MSSSANIFLSDNIVSHSTQGGVSRFFRHLTEGIVAAFGEQTILYSPKPPAFPQARYVRTPGISGRVHDLTASVVAAYYRPKVFLTAYYGQVFTNARQVYVVYDMIHEILPHYFRTKTSYERRFVAEKRHCLRTGDLLIAISQSTAQDIINVYPEVNKDTILVAHLGVDARFFDHSPWVGVPLPRPYLLYVGQRSVYKNFRRLLIAYAESGLAGVCDLRVISAEYGGFTADEQAIITRYGLDSVVHHRLHVSDAELVAHYAHALALVYPSEYEGFGLPIIEAMATGTLVATSNRSSMLEIGGEVAFYFDPTSTESIARTLHHLIALSPEERAERRSAGVERARTFNWQSFHQKVHAALMPLLQCDTRIV